MMDIDDEIKRLKEQNKELETLAAALARDLRAIDDLRKARSLASLDAWAAYKERNNV